MLGHHHHHHDNNSSSSRTQQQQLVSYVQDYLECVESLPLDIQRNVSLLREIDSKYQEVLKEVDDVFSRYQGERDVSQRRRLQLQLQRALIASQELGDQKISVVTQMTELVENRSRQMDSHSLGLQEPGIAGGGGGAGTPDRPTSTATERRSASGGSVLPSEASEQQQRSSARRPRRQQQQQQQQRTSESSSSLLSLAPPPPNGGGGASRDPAHHAAAAGGEDEEDEEEEGGAAARDPARPVPSSSSSSAAQQQPRSDRKSSSSSKSAKKKKRKSAKQERDVAASSPVDLAPVDPDEPTYCLCEQVSYGEMIGCDNDRCPIEWFHFSCVALTYKPKGKWFCPRCRGDSEKTMDRRPLLADGRSGRKERRSR